MTPVLEAYDDTPDLTANISYNKVNEDDKYQLLKTISKKNKSITYPKLKVGDDVCAPVINKVQKG